MRVFKPQYSKLLDEELMVLLSKGDKRAFDEVYGRYAQPLFGYFMKLLPRKCTPKCIALFRSHKPLLTLIFPVHT